MSSLSFVSGEKDWFEGFNCLAKAPLLKESLRSMTTLLKKDEIRNKRITAEFFSGLCSLFTVADSSEMLPLLLEAALIIIQRNLDYAPSVSISSFFNNNEQELQKLAKECKLHFHQNKSLSGPLQPLPPLGIAHLKTQQNLGAQAKLLPFSLLSLSYPTLALENTFSAHAKTVITACTAVAPFRERCVLNYSILNTQDGRTNQTSLSPGAFISLTAI